MAETGFFRACSHRLTWDEIKVVSVREKLSLAASCHLVAKLSLNVR